jgi:cell division protein YceG involved in septum cleavage
VCFAFNYGLTPVSNNDKVINVTIENNKKDIDSVVKTLERYNLLRNSKVFIIYINIYKIKEFKAGKYKLSENMNAKEIARILTR